MNTIYVMQEGFKTWLEGSLVSDAVVGIVAGSDRTSDEERSHLMSRSTSDFSSSIRSRLKSLGIVNSMPKSLILKIRRSIDDGIEVGELIRILKSNRLNEDRYGSEMDAMAMYHDYTPEEPAYMRTPENMAKHLRKKGLSNDEVEKAVASKFGMSSRIASHQPKKPRVLPFVKF